MCAYGLTFVKTQINRLARRREYDRCRRAAITPEQHQLQREMRRLRREMETDEETEMIKVGC